MSVENIKLALEVVNTLAIVIASIVAICGINAWRKEFQEKRNIELAEEVLALFYEAKDAIRAIRNPFSYQGEGKTRKPQENETPREKEARDRFYFVFERFEKRQEIFNKLHSKRYQFMARFGTEKSKPFEDLRMIVIEIQVSANSLSRIWSSNHISEDMEKRRQEHESIIWIGGEDDPIESRVKKIISDIEAICRPIIMGKK
jgi:ADP-heptose:LPS heptosyltransferase